MSQSPTGSAGTSQIQAYDKAWAALNLLIREGHGFSGHERNCAFLNLGPGEERFANVSAATGLDFDDDGRGLALADWDWDGDPDFWISNRTAPGVRFVRNDLATGNRSVAFRLSGTRGNRDALGARVELALGDGTKRIRTRRAGHSHLSQSSEWLSFGLGKERASSVTVRWPGGKAEAFDLGAQNGDRYDLVEGAGQATPTPPRPAMKALVPTFPEMPKVGDGGRIVILAPAPVPELTVRDESGKERELVPVSAEPRSPLLVNLWATWCAPCVAEMGEWTAEREKIEAAGLEIVSVSVDDETTRTKVPAFARKLNYPWPTAYPGTLLIDRLETLQRTFIGRQSALPIPSSFLIDAQGRIAVIYRGPVTAAQLLDDVKLLGAPPQRILAGAVPFEGRWIGTPRPTSPKSVAIKFLNRGSLAESEHYLRRLLAYEGAFPAAFSDGQIADLRNYLGAVLYDQHHYPEALAEWENYNAEVPGNRATLIDIARARTVLGLHAGAAGALREALRSKRDDPELLAQLARSLAAAGNANPSEVADLYRESLALAPDPNVRYERALILGTSGRLAEAITELRACLAARPDWPPAANNLAWLLATSGDAALRDGEEAVRLAELAKTPGLAFTFGTLSAAYAETGRFEDALRVVDEAIAIESAKDKPEGLDVFQEMKEAFAAKRAYRDTRLGKVPATE